MGRNCFLSQSRGDPSDAVRAGALRGDDALRLQSREDSVSEPAETSASSATSRTRHSCCGRSRSA